jgi:hypothetical protein
MVLLVPAGALAHDGSDSRDSRSGHHRHHHHGVLLKGTVKSVDASAGTLVVNVTKASRGGKALVGDDVTVKVVRAASLEGVDAGETVLVKTKRRFVNASSNSISAALVSDGERDGDRDGDRDGRCDHRS